MSIAATVTALENFCANDDALLELLLSQKDTELAEVEMALSQQRARIQAQKDAIRQEFTNRKVDLRMILEGNP